jgi:hypothetical protein
MKVKKNQYLFRKKSFFIKLFFTIFVITGRIEVYEHRVLAKAADFFPRDDDLLAFSEAEDTAIEKHGDRANGCRADIENGIVYVAKTFSVAEIDDLLFS